MDDRSQRHSPRARHGARSPATTAEPPAGPLPQQLLYHYYLSGLQVELVDFLAGGCRTRELLAPTISRPRIPGGSRSAGFAGTARHNRRGTSTADGWLLQSGHSRSDSDGSSRLLTIMGSGEIAPTMVKVHRAMLERLGPEPVPAVLLDTPFAFQENAPELCERIRRYFAESLRAEIEVAASRPRRPPKQPPGRSGPTVGDAFAEERLVSAVRRARYVFTGPGSPSYALSQVDLDRRPLPPQRDARPWGRPHVLLGGRPDPRGEHRARLRGVQSRRRPVLAGGSRPDVLARGCALRSSPTTTMPREGRTTRGSATSASAALRCSRRNSPPRASCSGSTSTRR